MTELEQAVNTLRAGNHTCVLRKSGIEYTSDARGVKPLLDALHQGLDLIGASCADRVVGNGAAYVYVLLKVKEVYAEVISEPAEKTLLQAGISVSYGARVPAIMNRTKDGFCPIEQAVQDAVSPENALELIEKRLKTLK